jgi:predicted RNase H-like HicB family nuclease
MLTLLSKAAFIRTGRGSDTPSPPSGAVGEREPAWAENGQSLLWLLQALKHRVREVTDIAMKFAITIDRDEDGMWVVECPSIPGCVSQGKTKAEALKNIREAIELCLEVRAERGLPLTVETRQVEVTL